MLNEIQQNSQNKMNKSINSLKNAFSKIRASRAHPSLLEQIHINYYGSMVPLSQVANIITEDSRTLKASPWEKDMVSVIEKAIMTSDLGLNPQTIGQVIRIHLPPLTQERRGELVKVVKDEAEKAKIAIRNIRRDANSDFKELLKEKEISKDEARKAEYDIQKITDKYIKKIEINLNKKEDSLLEI